VGDRSGEIRILPTTFNDHLLRDKSPIFSSQIEPRLDGDRAMHAEQPFAGTLVYKAADFSSGVRVQFKAPLDPIARVAACHRLETQIREAGLRHLLDNIARQIGAAKSWQCARCFHMQNSQGCGKY